MAVERRRRRAAQLATLGYLVLALATAAAFYVTWTNQKATKRERAARIQQLNRINVEQCASLRNLYLVIRLTIVESDKNIDKTAYYRSHPFERRRAHMANQATINRFRQPPCPKRIVVPQ